jgi:hypothetical protein
MNHNRDRYDGDWLDSLDSLIAGDALPPEEDEDLLHVATRLASALAPLRETAGTTATHRYHANQQTPFGQIWRKRQARQHLSPAKLLVSALLLLLCLVGGISVKGGAPLWQDTHEALQHLTSLDQINGISIASLSPPHAGLKPLPLLPAVLPANTQTSTYGVLTDASNPNRMTTFVADYHINGQDVQLFEQPSDVIFLSTTAQIVQIGAQQGQLFQDSTGDHALQWYQNNMLCQLTSKLPIALLVQLASAFRPIGSWDLIR